MGNLLTKKKNAKKKDRESLAVFQQGTRRFATIKSAASDDGMSADDTTISDDEAGSYRSGSQTDSLVIEDIEEYPDSELRCYTPDEAAPPSPNDHLPKSRSDVEDGDIPSPLVEMAASDYNTLYLEKTASTCEDSMIAAGDAEYSKLARKEGSKLASEVPDVAAAATADDEMAREESDVAAAAKADGELARYESGVAAAAKVDAELARDGSDVAAATKAHDELARYESDVAAAAKVDAELARDGSDVAAATKAHDELARDESDVAAAAKVDAELARDGSDVAAAAKADDEFARYDIAIAAAVAEDHRVMGVDNAAAESKGLLNNEQTRARKTEEDAIKELNELAILGVVAKGGMAFDIEGMSNYRAPPFPSPRKPSILVVHQMKNGKGETSQGKKLKRHVAFDVDVKGGVKGKRNPTTARVNKGSTITSYKKSVTTNAHRATGRNGVTGILTPGTKPMRQKPGPPPRKQTGPQPQTQTRRPPPIRQAHGTVPTKKANAPQSTTQAKGKRSVKPTQAMKRTHGQRSVKQSHGKPAPNQTRSTVHRSTAPRSTVPRPTVMAIDRIKREAREMMPTNTANKPVDRTKQIKLGKPPDIGIGLVETKGGVAFEVDFKSPPVQTGQNPRVHVGQSRPTHTRARGERKAKHDGYCDNPPDANRQTQPHTEPLNRPNNMATKSQAYAEYLKKNPGKSWLQIKRDLEADIERLSRPVESPDEEIVIGPRPMRKQTEAQVAETDSISEYLRWRKARRTELQAQGLTPAEVFAQINVGFQPEDSSLPRIATPHLEPTFEKRSSH